MADAQEFTQWALLKLPQRRQILFRSYRNAQARSRARVPAPLAQTR